MKKLLLMLIIPIAMTAQKSDTETFSVSMTAGTSIGAEIEYKGSIGYVRPSIQFSRRSTEFYSALGINFNEDGYNTMRYYLGGRLGLTAREDTNALAGFEGGIDVRLGSNLFLGVRASNDYHSDYTFYENGKKWNQGFILRIGTEW